MAPGSRWGIVMSTVEFVALAVWIGGLIVIVASVIPAVFNSFGMEPGGRFLTRVFQGYNRLLVVAAGALLVTLLLRHLVPMLKGVARVGRAELVVTLVMVAVAGLIVFVLEPNSVKLQEEAF